MGDGLGQLDPLFLSGRHRANRAEALFTEADGRALGILSHGDPGQGACTNPAERNSYAPVSTILDRANARTGNTLQLRLVTGGGVVVPMPPR